MDIAYDPSKTPQEMADAAGVSLTTVRNFLQRNPSIDYRTDRTNYLLEQIKALKTADPTASDKDIAETLKLSLPTVKKYRKLSESGKIINKKRNDPRKNYVKGLSVNNNDADILRDILEIHLPGRKTFDCDLTFGRGEFYSRGLQAPEYRYDKYLYEGMGSKRYPTAPLDEAMCLPDGCFESVVIDLPLCIDNLDSGVNAFKSLNGMFDSYHEMIALGSRLLKKGGILVFKTADFVLRNDDGATYSGQWATDHAIDYALELGFDLSDRFILARRESLQTTGSTKVRTGLKHGYFLVFSKNGDYGKNKI